MPPKDNNIPHFDRSDLFGGKGRVRIWNLIPPNTTHAPFTASLWCSLEAMGNVGRHLQQVYPEIIICLSGKGRISVDDASHEFQVGTQVYLPLGSVLAIQNEGEEELEYLIIKAKG